MASHQSEEGDTQYSPALLTVTEVVCLHTLMGATEFFQESESHEAEIQNPREEIDLDRRTVGLLVEEATVLESKHQISHDMSQLIRWAIFKAVRSFPKQKHDMPFLHLHQTKSIVETLRMLVDNSGEFREIEDESFVNYAKAIGVSPVALADFIEADPSEEVPAEVIDKIGRYYAMVLY
ncbi:MAG: hypothetical protein AAB357_03970 [Actinomycetota bacterium]